jgi:transposase-like protein
VWREQRAVVKKWVELGRVRGKVGCDATAMEVIETIRCPYCGQSFELVVDTSTATQRFTTDCEVCCRPFEVFAECEPGEVLSLEVQGG